MEYIWLIWIAIAIRGILIDNDVICWGALTISNIWIVGNCVIKTIGG